MIVSVFYTFLSIVQCTIWYSQCILSIAQCCTVYNMIVSVLFTLLSAVQSTIWYTRDINKTWTHETERLVTVVAKGHSSSRRTGWAIFYFHQTPTAQLKQRSQVYEYGRNMLIDCILRALEVFWLYVYVTLIVIVFFIIIIIIIIRMIERSICYFKTRGDRRATKGDKRGRQSTTIMNYVKGMKEESGGNKVDQFWEIYMWERELFIWFSHLSWASGEILE